MQTIEQHASRRPAASPPQKVVVVNGNPDILEVLETVLDAGRYDMTFVEATDHAYSQIRQVQPDLVILCMEFDEPEGFQLLSMLKLDAETRRISVVTCTGDAARASDEDEDDTLVDEDAFSVVHPAMTMN
jgi:CheY-like chemotaxis protein